MIDHSLDQEIHLQILGTWNVPGPKGTLLLNDATLHGRLDL